MLHTIDNMPFWLMKENDKWQLSGYGGRIVFKDDTPIDVLRSYINHQIECLEMMGYTDVRPKIETLDFAEMRKRIGYTEEQINEEIVKIYPKKFADEYLRKSPSLFKAMEVREEIRNSLKDFSIID